MSSLLVTLTGLPPNLGSRNFTERLLQSLGAHQPNDFNYIDTSTLPAFLEFTLTNPVYPDYQFDTSIESQGSGISRDEAEGHKDEKSGSEDERRLREWRSIDDSQSDYPGCESSDLGSGDEMSLKMKVKMKALRKKAFKFISSRKSTRNIVSVPKIAWKFMNTDTEVNSMKGEEADVDEPGTSSPNQFNKKRRRLNSIEALVSKLPNTTLEIFPTKVIYDSKVDRPKMARLRLSLKRPLTIEKSDEFVKRVKFMKGI
ncbi:hypothetical protein DFH28DRAFT_979477, partial [Melampsora americana]